MSDMSRGSTRIIFAEAGLPDDELDELDGRASAVREA